MISSKFILDTLDLLLDGVTVTSTELAIGASAIVNSDHVDPPFRDVDPPAKRAIRVRA